MVDAVALAREAADAVPLGEVADGVGAGCVGVVLGDRRQAVADALVVQQRTRRNLVRLQQRRCIMRRILRGGDAEVEVEVALVAGRPVEAPAHAPTVGEQLLERRA